MGLYDSYDKYALSLSHFAPDDLLVLLRGVSILCSLPAAASSTQQHPGRLTITGTMVLPRGYGKMTSPGDPER
jgi:hypothetical protein